jgi:hypothetical protein
METATVSLFTDGAAGEGLVCILVAVRLTCWSGMMVWHGETKALA